MEQKYQKQTDYLKKNLNNQLKSFERCKSWADIGNWMHKVEELFKEHPTPFIQEKLVLAKRLAQCLNPNLPPGIHSNALVIYDLIFKNICLLAEEGKDCKEKIKKNKQLVQILTSDLPYFSIGLFPFFQYASPQIKPEILNILKNYFFPLGIELIPCLPGLIVSILPGIEETNEAIQKEVSASLDLLAESVGEKHFYGCMWMSILRVNKIRNAGLKYLNKRLKKLQRQNEQRDQSQSITQFSQSGQSVSSGSNKEDQQQEQSQFIEQTKQVIQKTESSYQERQNDEKIDQPPRAETVVKQSSDKENEIREKQESQNEEQEEQKDGTVHFSQMLDIQQNYFQANSLQSTKNSLHKQIMEVSGFNNTENSDILYPNTSGLILNSLLISLEDSSQLVKRNVLDLINIAFPINSEDTLSENDKLILVQGCIKLYGKKEHATQTRIDKWLFGHNDQEKSLSDYTENIQNLIVNALIKIIEQTAAVPESEFKKTDHVAADSNEITYEQHLIIPLKIFQNFFMVHEQIVPLIIGKLSHSLINYIRQFYQFKEVQKATERLYQSIGSYSKDLLLSIISIFTQDLKNQKQNMNALILVKFSFTHLIFNNENVELEYQVECIKPMIQFLINNVCQLSIEEFFTFQYAQASLELVYELVQKMKYNQQDDDQYTEEDQEFIEKFTVYFIQLCNYVNESFDDGEQTRDINLDIFSVSSKILNVLQKYYLEDGKQNYEDSPEWLQCLIKFLNLPSPGILVIAIQSLIDIIVSANAYESYQPLRDFFEGKNLKHIYCMFSNLWKLLDYHFQEQKLIDFILIIQQEYPIIFQEVIHKSFESEEELAVQRYTTYFSQTNDFFKRNSKLNRGVGLIPILTQLESLNPLIRQSCVSWLTDSSSNLFRVIDPLFETLIEAHIEAEIEFTEHHSYKYTKPYNTEKVLQTFHLLKLIQDQLKDLFIQYLYTIRISHKIVDIVKQSPFKSQLDGSQSSYLNLMIFLILRFIQGQGDDQVSMEFKKKNAIVNANCCEYLEKMFETSVSIDISQEILKNTLSKILTILMNLINRQDNVMQVQILNLLRVMVIKINECLTYKVAKGKQYSEQFLVLKQQVGSQMFFENLLNGLCQSQVFYVRAKFINIITVSVYMVSEFLEEQVLNENIKKILETFFSIIHNVEQKDLEQKTSDDEDEESNINDELNFMRKHIAKGENIQNTSKRIFETFSQEKGQELRFTQHFKNQSLQNKSTIKKVYSNQTIKANQFSQDNFQEVINICDALKAVLNYFLRFREIKKTSTIKQENSIVLDILTLGLLRAQTEKRFSDHSQNKKFEATINLIVYYFPQVILSYLHIWNLSENFENHRLFTDKGIKQYEFENFKNYNHQLHEQIKKLQSPGTTDITKRHILEVMAPMSQQFMVPVLNAFIVIWIEESRKEFFDDAQQNLTMNRMIELMVTLDIQPDVFFSCIIHTSIIEVLNNHYNQKFQFKKSTFVYIYEYAEQENLVMFFVYTYLSYTQLQLLNKDKIQKIWEYGLKFLQIFKNSKVPQTIYWTIELLFLLSRKFSPKEIMADKQIRKEIHRYAKSQIETAALIAAQKIQYVTQTNIPQKSSKGDKQQSQIMFESKFKQLTPFTPSLYKAYQSYSNYLQYNEQDSMHQFFIEKIIFAPSQNNQEDVLNYNEFISRMSLVAFKTLKDLSHELLQNIYDNNDRIIQISKEFLLVTLPMMETRDDKKKLHSESSCELWHQLLNVSRNSLVHELRKNIQDIFMRNDFFKCTKVSLRYWTEIINLISDKGELLVELLTNQSFFPRVFSIGSDSDKKIKNLERICFIIYSGQKDQFQSQLRLLIDSMSEVIKDPDNAHPAVLILILFCVRILILRLSQVILLDLFRNIWPMILTLLMQIFDKKSSRKVNHNLTYAALKLIEMISIVQMEEFYLHQWIFVFDYFGVRLEPLNPMGENDQMGLVQETQIKQDKIGKVVSPFIHNTAISSSFPSEYKIDYLNQQFDEDIQTNFQKKKRAILLKEPLIQDEQELKLKVVFFCQYIININQMRLEVDHKELESVIEDDFITLDDYIHNIGKDKNY